MPQSKVEHDFALDRLRELNAKLTDCLSDSTALRARIVKAEEANMWFALRYGPAPPPGYSRKN